VEETFWNSQLKRLRINHIVISAKWYGILHRRHENAEVKGILGRNTPAGGCLGRTPCAMRFIAGGKIGTFIFVRLANEQFR
jgi:hypothetical protein